MEKKRRQITVIIFPNPRGTGACVFKFKDGSHRFANGARLKDYETSNAGREQNVRCTHKARRILIKASWRRVDEGGKANHLRDICFFFYIFFFFNRSQRVTLSSRRLRNDHDSPCRAIITEMDHVRLMFNFHSLLFKIWFSFFFFFPLSFLITYTSYRM